MVLCATAILSGFNNVWLSGLHNIPTSAIKTNAYHILIVNPKMLDLMSNMQLCSKWG